MLGPKTVTSALSEFNITKLEVIHSFMSLRHAWNLTSSSVLSGFMDK